MPLTKELEKFGFQKVEGDTSSIFEKLKIKKMLEGIY